jgi:hypothetical protein
MGLLKGALVGGLLGAVCIYGLGMPVVAAWLAYLGAVLAGALTGLVAGRPIWAKGARIEAGLKAGAGALLAAAGMFAIRKWLGVSLDLGALGHGVIGDLPIVAFPMVATALALFFEIDNTGGEPEPPKKTRVESVELGSDAAAEAEEAPLEEEEDAVDKARRH